MYTKPAKKGMAPIRPVSGNQSRINQEAVEKERKEQEKFMKSAHDKTLKKLLPKSEMDKTPAKKSASGKVLGGKEKKNDMPKETGGMGTPVAEYSEAGPFSCGMCWYLQSAEPRQDPQGLCNEPHMLRDPKTEKTKVGGKTFAIVDKVHGCCRFIDPVKPTEPREEFVFAGDSDEEAEEHGHEGDDEGTDESE